MTLVPPSPQYRSLFARVFLGNAAVLAGACAVTVLVLSPGTISSGVALKELAILGGGLALMVVVNVLLMRRALAPLLHLTRAVREIDPQTPRHRVPVHRGHSEAHDLGEAFNEALERLEAERRDSARRALDAQEGERLRVARELHDEVGQRLTAALLHLGRTSRRVPPELRDEIAEAQDTVRDSLDDVRRITQRLRPEALDDLGLPSALSILAERVSVGTELEVRDRVDDVLPPLSADEELVVYRIAQEALTNVARHAGAGHAELMLQHRSRSLLLRVVDDGDGIDGVDPGSGILGMRERAALVGAELTISERPDGGTEVLLDLPLVEPSS